MPDNGYEMVYAGIASFGKALLARHVGPEEVTVTMYEISLGADLVELLQSPGRHRATVVLDLTDGRHTADDPLDSKGLVGLRTDLPRPRD